MSHSSRDDGYQRLLDFGDALHSQQRHSSSGQTTSSAAPHTSLTVQPLQPKAPPSTSSASTHASSRGRQKKGRKMAWLLIHNTSEVQQVHMDKRQLIQVMGLEIPMRDLRLMDPALAAFHGFAQILVRDNALVVSAEHVHLIITCDKVIFPLDFEKTEASQRFIKTIESIIRERPDCMPPQPKQPDSPQVQQQQQPQQQLLLPHELQHAGSLRLHRGASLHGALYSKDPELLPFELNMLEAALGEITRHYAQHTGTLESLAHPALDALMRKCNSTNLERVRKIKTQHQRLQGRLQGLREILERYMEDDQDMYRMCLSKMRLDDLEGADAGSDNTLLIGRREGYLSANGASLPRRATVTNLARSPTGMMDRFQSMSMRAAAHRSLGDDSSSSSSSSSSSKTDQHDLLEVENLLESYLMMVDGTLAKLTGIGEYIDDTEDYINIELDYNRNRLLRIEILLTVATFALSIYTLVAGILGENLVLPTAWTQDIRGFILINGTTLTVCTTVFYLMWRAMVVKKLI